jgi:hypothetical protein
MLLVIDCWLLQAAGQMQDSQLPLLGLTVAP